MPTDKYGKTKEFVVVVKIDWGRMPQDMESVELVLSNLTFDTIVI
jgi:hypothetical protein